MSSSLIGNQNPRISLEPKQVSTDGGDVADLASAYGLIPDDWQQHILDVWMGRDKHDNFTARTCGLTVPRQNGKNALLEMRELYGLCVIGEQILHSAHEVKTAAMSFRRLCGFFQNPEKYPELCGMLLQIRRTNGQEAIELINGGRIVFSARSRGANRGMTFDLVVFDEAQELTDEQLEAVMSTMAAAPLRNRQTIYTGTPPSPSGHGDVFARIRKQALAQADDSLSWHEWSVDGMPVDVSDKDLWYATNPALGIRLDESFTNTECNTMSKEGFARERLGYWSDSATVNAVFTKKLWEACESEPPEPDENEHLAIGVKFTADGANVALSVAVKHPDRKTYIECLEYDSMSKGMAWLSDWIIARKNKIAVCSIDGRSNTATLVQRLIDGGFPKRAINVMGVNDVCSAASMFYNAVVEINVLHSDQPLLDDSAIYAKRRPIGNNGGWGFGSGLADCAPIESASFAFWGAETTKRNPVRKMRVG